jgi:hypothetical protein
MSHQRDTQASRAAARRAEPAGYRIYRHDELLSGAALDDLDLPLEDPEPLPDAERRRPRLARTLLALLVGGGVGLFAMFLVRDMTGRFDSPEPASPAQSTLRTIDPAATAQHGPRTRRHSSHRVAARAVPARTDQHSPTGGARPHAENAVTQRSGSPSLVPDSAVGASGSSSSREFGFEAAG